MTESEQELETTEMPARGGLRGEEMTALYEIAHVLDAAVNLDEMLKVILEQVCQMLACDLSFVSLAVADDSALRVQAVVGKEAMGLLGVEFSTDQGINAWIYREGKPALVGDADTDPRRLHIEGRTESIRSAVGAPLIVGGQPIGTIYAARREPHTLTEAHSAFLEIVASQTAAVVQRARFLEEAQQRAAEMESIHNIGAVLASSLDVDRILQTLYVEAGRIMDTSAFFVALCDEEREQLCFELAYDHGERLAPFTTPLTAEGFAAHIVRTGQPILIRNLDLEREPLPFSPLVVGKPTRSWLGVPIVFQDNVLGVISVQSYEPYAFTARQLKLLSAIANQAGVALKNALLFADIQQAHEAAAKERDKLTRLHQIVVRVQRADDIPTQLQVVADGIRDLGWERVSVSLRDAELDVIELACAGFTAGEEAALRANLLPGSVWRQRFGGEFERFRVGSCYYLPWVDPWVRNNVRGVPGRDAPPVCDSGQGAPAGASEEKDAWHPEDLLYVPLYGRVDQIIGIIGLDEPQDGRRPTVESLSVVELFACEAALALENAKLLAELKLVNTDLQEMVDAQAHLLHTIDEMVTVLDLKDGFEAFGHLAKEGASRA